MTLPRALAIPAAVAVVLTVVGAWVDGSRSSSSSPPATVPATSSTIAVAVANGPATSCTSVVHVGDSTSVGLVSEDFIADPAARVDAQYRRVGVADPRMEISGARSIVETVGEQLNAADAAAAVKATGYEGCWVLAMGTTDTANVAVGSPVDRPARIDRMLAVIGDDPILWVTVKTLETEGDWSEANMQLWNETLREAQARYPNIRLFDWAAVVQDAWFQDDGIHYTSAGNVERARLIADALVAAYPP
jgi:hypothetical protein